MMRSFDSIPILLIFLAIVLLGTLAVELGFKLGRHLRREDGLDKYPIESSASGTVLGLLAFILAFSFGVSASRFAELREIARLDTDSIEDLYLLADFLPEDPAETLRSQLHDYHRERIEAVKSRDPAQFQKAIKRSEEIHESVWALVVSERTQAEGSLLNPLVTATQTWMDMHAIRINKAFVTRLPAAIWGTTLALLMLSALLLGISSGLHGKRSRLASGIVVLCFSAVLVMIVDLDRPVRTLFARSLEPSAEALLEKMTSDASEPPENQP